MPNDIILVNKSDFQKFKGRKNVLRISVDFKYCGGTDHKRVGYQIQGESDLQVPMKMSHVIKCHMSNITWHMSHCRLRMQDRPWHVSSDRSVPFSEHWPGLLLWLLFFKYQGGYHYYYVELIYNSATIPQARIVGGQGTCAYTIQGGAVSHPFSSCHYWVILG